MNRGDRRRNRRVVASPCSSELIRNKVHLFLLLLPLLLDPFFPSRLHNVVVVDDDDETTQSLPTCLTSSQIGPNVCCLGFFIICFSCRIKTGFDQQQLFRINIWNESARRMPEWDFKKMADNLSKQIFDPSTSLAAFEEIIRSIWQPWIVTCCR